MDEGKEQIKMPSTKIKAFFSEFPWVKGFCKDQEGIDREINQVYVSRITPKLLDYYPLSITEPVGFDGNEYWNEAVYFIDGNGLRVDFIREEKCLVKKYVFFGPLIERKSTLVDEGETYGDFLSIKEVLESLEVKARDVRFVLSYFMRTKAVIIYKVPKDTHILD